MLFQQLLKLEQRPIDSCFKSLSFSAHISLFFGEGASIFFSPIHHLFPFRSQIPSLPLYKSGFTDPPSAVEDGGGTETLLAIGKGQAGSVRGRGHGVYIWLRNAYRSNSNREGQSGERRRGGRLGRERLTAAESGGRDPQLIYCKTIRAWINLRVFICNCVPSS